MSQIHEILKKYWGYDSFRPLQEEIITSVIQNQDTLALLPTGGGKSICFQVPALAVEGICIVVSPLIALMRDQVMNLKKVGINAIAIYSGMKRREIDHALDNCIYGSVKFLYVSPERLKTELFIARVKKMKVGLIAVDEAHCISQWGYDFRPPYLEIANLRNLVPPVPIIALTASATKKVCADIQDKLLFKSEQVFRKSFARANLSYRSYYSEDKLHKLLETLTQYPGSAVVYVRSRAKTKQVANWLNENGINATFYHAGLEGKERTQKQEAWIADEIQVIVSTNAFGMGIDKPNVRAVVHLDIPPDLESYYQEAGRAGRDEKDAVVVLLYDQTDIKNLHENVIKQHPNIALLKAIYQGLADYYRLAIGSGEGESFALDLNAFAPRYGLKKDETYYGLKKLVNQGLIAMSDAFSNQSKVLMVMNHLDIEQYQREHDSDAIFIQWMLRIYGGEIFSNFVSIDEQRIARELASKEEEVRAILVRLAENEVIKYQEQTDLPVITFIRAREDSNRLSINKKFLDQQRELAKHKVDSIINYAENVRRCRTQMILEYFDEISDARCGKCDFCIKSNLDNTADNQQDLRAQILTLLQTNSMSLNDLKSKLINQSVDDVSSTIKELLDVGDICFDSGGSIRLKNDE